MYSVLLKMLMAAALIDDLKLNSMYMDAYENLRLNILIDAEKAGGFNFED